jgi:hypothetical protein
VVGLRPGSGGLGVGANNYSPFLGLIREQKSEIRDQKSEVRSQRSVSGLDPADRVEGRIIIRPFWG